MLLGFVFDCEDEAFVLLTVVPTVKGGSVHVMLLDQFHGLDIFGIPAVETVAAGPGVPGQDRDQAGG